RAGRCAGSRAKRPGGRRGDGVAGAASPRNVLHTRPRGPRDGRPVRRRVEACGAHRLDKEASPVTPVSTVASERRKAPRPEAHEGAGKPESPTDAVERRSGSKIPWHWIRLRAPWLIVPIFL